MTNAALLEGKNKDGIVVMYHYVWERADTPSGGVRPLWRDEFEAQLDWLSERFEIIGPNALLTRLHGGSRSKRPFCLLTFDDGTKDHARVVMPVLQKRGLSGLFFVLSGPWTGTCPISHQILFLLQECDEHMLWGAIEKAMETEVNHELAERILRDTAVAEQIYWYEKSHVRRLIKYTLNFALPLRAAKSVLRTAAAGYKSEAEIAQMWFLSREEAVAMQSAGLVIGSHGHTHVALSRLDSTEAEREVTECHRILTGVLGKQPQWFAYPFGGAGTECNLEHCDRVLESLRYQGVFVGNPPADELRRLSPKSRLSRITRLDGAHLPPRAAATFELH